MAKDLEGKTALVTGAGRGIGRAIARKLGAAGALVAVNYAADAAAAQRTVADIEAAGGAAFAARARIDQPGAPAVLAAALDAELTRRTGGSGLDILVNNVGAAERGRIDDATPELFDRAIGVNLKAPFFVIQALLPRLREGARIINISTAGTRLASGDFVTYSVAKAGLEMLTTVLAKELGPRRIAVNAVLPGYTRTDQVAATLSDPKTAAALAAQVAFGRLGEPEDVGDFVCALASPAGRWVTGQLIEVSGGFRL
jgi:NAD(P)-dependent dehydrogenase (short-subunit alcohol dehydrogenase family)